VFVTRWRLKRCLKRIFHFHHFSFSSISSKKTSTRAHNIHKIPARRPGEFISPHKISWHISPRGSCNKNKSSRVSRAGMTKMTFYYSPKKNKRLHAHRGTAKWINESRSHTAERVKSHEWNFIHYHESRTWPNITLCMQRTVKKKSYIIGCDMHQHTCMQANRMEWQ
jgi:hypothetical protein